MSSAREILVVEDNPQNYELVEFLLEDAGFSVRRAADAEELRRQLAAALPDMILMDIQLPGVDGMSLVREVRAMADAGARPIVALTAHAMRGDRERFIAAGFDGYISKPIAVGSFAGEVAGYLD
jgi:two-component system, cell cycle response regulator DivK